MEISVNGQAMQIHLDATIAELMKMRALRAKRSVVERNGVVVLSEKWHCTVLCPGDRLEIVTFVGGG